MSGAQAQEISSDELSLSDILELRVTALATGTAMPVHLAPSVTTVISAADIKAMGARSFEEVIDTVPGMHTTMGSFGAPKYYIRGMATLYNPETLVMVNGFPISSSVRGDRNGKMAVLPVSMISRIEVIRGPGSALYGAEAFAGVINVITKNADDLKNDIFGLRSGSFNTQEGWLQTAAAYENFKFSFLANYMTTEGHKREIDVDALKTSPLAITPGPMSLGGQTTDFILDIEKNKLRFHLAERRLENQGSGQGLGDNLDPYTRGSRYRLTSDLTYQDKNLMPDLEFTVKAGLLMGEQEFQTDILIFPPGMNLGSGVFPDGVRGKPEFKERNITYDVAIAYKGMPSQIIRAGAGGGTVELYDVRETKNFTSTFAPRGSMEEVTDTPEIWILEKRRENSHVFVQDEWNFIEDWQMTVGTRFDHFSDFGDTFNPRGALVWQTSSQLTSKFMYGKAFRSPNFVELYSQNNPITIGNPSLKPTTNEVYELAFAFIPNQKINVGLNLYHYTVKNNIGYMRDGVAATATAQNAGLYSGDGLEVETQYKMNSELSFIGNYSYVKTNVASNGKQVGDYPTHQAYVRQEWAVSSMWNLNGQLRWIGARPRTPADTRSEVKPYTSLDLIVRGKKVFAEADLGFWMRNVLDADIREPSAPPSVTSGNVTIPNDYPQEGRSLFAELTWAI